MMERRPWSKRVDRRLPLRYRDVLPEATPIVGPSSSSNLSGTPAQSLDNRDTPSFAASARSVGKRIQQFFSTHRNKFGLFRQYHREGPPLHDPEENIALEDLFDIDNQATIPASSISPDSYHPYPNRNAFLLGDWYWNGGPQKSQTSFKDLLNIIGDPNFRPADVQQVKWDQINETLADDRI